MTTAPAPARVPSRVRRARVATAIVFGVNGALFATWAARVPAVQQQYQLTPGQLGIALAGMAVGAVAGLLGVGPLVTRWGSTIIVSAGFAVFAAAIALVGYVPDLAGLTGVLVVFGIGNSAVDVAMNTHAVVVEQAYGRPIFASFHAVWSLGNLCGAAAGAILATAAVRIQNHFLLAALVLGTVGVLAARLGFVHDRAAPGATGVGTAWKDRRILLIGIIMLCAFIAEGTANDWAAVHLHQSGADQATAALGYLAFSAGMVIGRLITDHVMVRAGTRRFLLLTTALAATGLVLATAAPAPTLGIAGFAVFGLGLAGLAPALLSATGHLSPTNPAPTIATVATIGYLGFLTGPVLVGGIAEVWSLTGAFGVVACLLAVALALIARASFVTDPSPQPEER